MTFEEVRALLHQIKGIQAIQTVKVSGFFVAVLAIFKLSYVFPSSELLAPPCTLPCLYFRNTTICLSLNRNWRAISANKRLAKGPQWSWHDASFTSLGVYILSFYGIVPLYL